jgi:hypothetical protein
MALPEKLVEDVCVAGVIGGRTSDEKNPRAWIVLSEKGRERGAKETMEAVDNWVKKTLSKYKWLRGGIEVVDEVSSLTCVCPSCWRAMLIFVSIIDSQITDGQSLEEGVAGPI